MRRYSLIALFAAGLALGVALGAAFFRHLGTAGAIARDMTASASPVPSGNHFAPVSAVPARSASAAASGPGGQAADIRVDPAMLQDLGVRTTLVQPRTVTESIRTTGYVDYDQRLLIKVNARVSGWVQKLYVAYTGQPVRRGETLLDIYSPELVLTQEDYLRARQLSQGAGDSETGAGGDGASLMTAAETRLRLWGISPIELRKLARRGVPSETMPIESPTSGVVTESKIVEGAHVRAGDDLYTIADLSHVWVYADIYESELPKAHAGQRAEVTTDALPGRRFSGLVTYIYPSVNEQSRTVRLRLEFANPGLELRPGMYVEATLLHRAAAPTLAVPVEAVLDSGVRRIVIVARGGGHFEPREIRVGTQSEGYFQVQAGLAEGERVVTSAQFLIDSESNLNEALSAMSLKSSPASEPGASTSGRALR
jgi:Cu(I)/Ag(I) efflux system membrane fusion protein